MNQPPSEAGRREPSPPAPAGWHPDPARRFPLRYWDGARWTEYVSFPGGPTRTDALPPVPPAVAHSGRVASPASRMRNPAGPIVVLVGAVVLAIASVLPWATVESPIFANAKVSGIRGDGQITLVLAIVLGVLGAIALGGLARKGLLIAALIVAAAAALTCAFDLNDVGRVAQRQTGIPVDARVGYGLYTALAGSVGAGIGSVIGLVKR